MPQYLDHVSRVSWADHAVALETAACLLQMCETRRPRRVLDTGSGFSSYVLRRYARQSGADVVSVGTVDTWQARTAGYLEETGVGIDDMQNDGHRAEARRVTTAAGRRYVSLARVTTDPIGRYAGLSVG